MSTPQNRLFLRSAGNITKGAAAEFLVSPVRRPSSKPAKKQDKKSSKEPVPVPVEIPIESDINREEQSETNSVEQLEMASHPHVNVANFSGQPGERGEIWLKRYENICKAVFNYNDAKVKSTFPFHLTGQAKTWYESLEDAIINDPDQLKLKFLERFDGSDGGFSISVVRQKPNESVHNYTTRFQDLFNGSDMPEKYVVTNYVDGLLPVLRRIVKPQELNSLDIARRAALRAEHSESDSIEVNSLSSTSTTDKKLDTLIDLMTHQLHLQQIPNRNQAPTRRRHDDPGETSNYTYKDGYILSALTIILFLGILPAAAASNILPRLNYGVVFQNDAKLTLSREYWLHTYEIKLPQHVSIPSIGTCHKDKNTCLMISHILTQLNAIRLETETRLNSTLDTVHKLVPHASFVRKTRSKRALLGFIGKFSKTLFGTATVDDVNVLAKHIDALTKRSKNLGDALVQHNRHLSSFMQRANKRMDNIMHGINENKVAIHFVSTQLEKSASSLQQTFEDISLVLIHQLQVANKLNHQLDELKLGILDLANGKLSPLIIPLEILQSTLNDIQSVLSKQYPGFYVATKAASELYHNSNFLYTRNNSILYVTLKVPITNSEQALHLYKVISKPVPINETSKHATQLLNMPDYFAISQNQQFYVEMSKLQIDSCKGTHHKYCHVNVPLTPVLKDSCALALFANARDKIHKICQFRFVHDKIEPQIYELSSNQILLYNTDMLTMECKGNHQMIKGCNFCIFDLPCQCSLQTQYFYLPPRLISCKNNTPTGITKMHPVNLVLLQEFFDEKQFKHIFADTTFQTPLNINVPKFKLYDHEMANILAADQKDHLNLSKMVEIAKNDGIVFQTLAEPILDGHIAIQSDWPDLDGILVLIAITLTGSTLFFIIFLFWKVRKLAATLIILQQTMKAKALPTTVPSFIYTHKTAATENQINFEFPLSWEHANFIFLLINSICLMIILVKIVNTRKTPRLILEITNMTNCVFISIMSLPLCPSHSNITVPEGISDLKITGTTLRPKLTITWSNGSVENQITETVVKTPDVVNLNIFQAFRLGRILKTPFFVHIHSEHNGYLSPIQLDSA